MTQKIQTSIVAGADAAAQQLVNEINDLGEKHIALVRQLSDSEHSARQEKSRLVDEANEDWRLGKTGQPDHSKANEHLAKVRPIHRRLQIEILKTEASAREKLATWFDIRRKIRTADAQAARDNYSAVVSNTRAKMVELLSFGQPVADSYVLPRTLLESSPAVHHAQSRVDEANANFHARDDESENEHALRVVRDKLLLAATANPNAA